MTTKKRGVSMTVLLFPETILPLTFPGAHFNQSGNRSQK